MAQSRELNQLIRGLIDSYPRDFSFPLGDDLSIPLNSELAFLEANPITAIKTADLSGARLSLTLRDAYCLASFAVRVSVYAVRTNAPQCIEPGVLCLVLDDNIIDWRDVLAAISLVDDCANRLRVNLYSLFLNVAQLATEERQGTIFRGYFSRSAEARRISVFGYRAVETIAGLSYIDVDDLGPP